MAKINGSRVIVGGLVAGVVCNIFEYVFNALVLKDRWDEAIKALGKEVTYTAGVMAVYICWAFLIGIMAVWLYAAIRPRFGAGPRTAVMAGFAMWIFVYVQGMIVTANMGVLPVGLLLISTIVGLVELVVAALVGAWLYKEEGQAAA